MSFYMTNDNIVIRPWKHGTIAYFKTDNPIGLCLQYYGEWAEQELQFLKHFLKEDSNVIDVGANIGTHTLFFSKTCPKGFVFSVEPQHYIFQLLVTNIMLNAAFNVVPFYAAISNDFEELHVLNTSPYATGNINFGEFKIHNAENGTYLQCHKLDNMFKNDSPKIDLIKLDVEEHEFSCIQSGISLIERNRPLLYVEFNALQGNRKLLELIDSLNYNIYWHFYPKHNVYNYHKVKNNIWHSADLEMQKDNINKFYESNIFCVPKENEQPSLMLKVRDFDDNLTRLFFDD